MYNLSFLLWPLRKERAFGPECARAAAAAAAAAGRPGAGPPEREVGVIGLCFLLSASFGPILQGAPLTSSQVVSIAVDIFDSSGYAQL